MECENERGWWRVGTGPQGVSRSLGALPLSLPVISLASRKKKRKKKGKEKKKITKQRVARTSSPSSSLIIYSDGEPSPAGDVIRLRRQSEREKEREGEEEEEEKGKNENTSSPSCGRTRQQRFVVSTVWVE